MVLSHGRTKQVEMERKALPCKSRSWVLGPLGGQVEDYVQTFTRPKPSNSTVAQGKETVYSEESTESRNPGRGYLDTSSFRGYDH